MILQSKDEQQQQQQPSQSKKGASPPRLVAVGGQILHGANVATNSAAAVNGSMATLLAAEAIASKASANNSSGAKSPVCYSIDVLLQVSYNN